MISQSTALENESSDSIVVVVLTAMLRGSFHK